MLKIPEDFMDQGTFSTPHFIFRGNVGLDRNERYFLIVLLAIEDDFLTGKNASRWFFATNRLIRERSGFSDKSIASIRRRLKEKGAIDFRIGHTGQATEYRILVDRFYRADKEAP